jgi:hypothetical protein
MRYDEQRHVWTSLVCPSRTSEREGKGYCVKGGWREEERVKERVRSVNPIPNPNPEQGVCVCLLLQDLVQSCLRGGGGIWEDMCYERRRAEACVD